MGSPKVGTIHVQRLRRVRRRLSIFGEFSQQTTRRAHAGGRSSVASEKPRRRARVDLPASVVGERVAPKKRAIWTRWRLVPGKNAYPRARSSPRRYPTDSQLQVSTSQKAAPDVTASWTSRRQSMMEQTISSRSMAASARASAPRPAA